MEQDIINTYLEEAELFNMRYEVELFAKEFIKQGYNRVDAYEIAFNEWIK